MSGIYDTMVITLETLLGSIKAPATPEPGDPAPTPPVYENTVAQVVADVIPVERIGKPGIFMAAPAVQYEDRASLIAEADDRINLYLVVDDEAGPQAALRSLERDVIKCLTAAGPGLGVAGVKLFKVMRGVNAEDVFPADGANPPGFRYPVGIRRLECQAVYQFSKSDGG